MTLPDTATPVTVDAGPARRLGLARQVLALLRRGLPAGAGFELDFSPAAKLRFSFEHHH